MGGSAGSSNAWFAFDENISEGRDPYLMESSYILSCVAAQSPTFTSHCVVSYKFCVHQFSDKRPG